MTTDASEWRVQVFLPTLLGGEHAYEPRLVVGRSSARRKANELRRSFGRRSGVRVECEPWDWSKDQATPAAPNRFGTMPVQQS